MIVWVLYSKCFSYPPLPQQIVVCLLLRPVIMLTGGMFEYVSGANYFGEIIEWTGYALAAWSLPTLSFAIFTVSNLAPRAVSHHK